MPCLSDPSKVPLLLGVSSQVLGDVDFGTNFDWGFAWGGFAWVSETGVCDIGPLNLRQKTRFVVKE